MTEKTHHIIGQLDQFRKLERRVADVKLSLSQHQMIENFKGVTTTHRMSAPLIDAFRATPGFDAAVKNFPQSHLYDTVAAHSSSSKNTIGLESLGEAEADAGEVVVSKARDVVATFTDILTGVEATATNLSAQVQEDTASLESSDLSDDVMASLPVHCMSGDAFSEMLTKLEDNLHSIEQFTFEDVQANPERIKDEVEGLAALVVDIGSVLGLALDEFGLVESDKDARFEPSPGDFGDKDISKTMLVFLLGKAEGVLEALRGIALRRDELIEGVNTALHEMPSELKGDDVTYGAIDHVTLLTSYTTLVAKLIREAVTVVSMLLTAVDSVLNVDSGIEE